MKLVTLKKEEFKKFAENHPQASFYQTIEWGELKEENNWQMVLLGLKDNEEIKAGCLLLSKDTPIKKKMFYSPRGFLIDYQDKELLKEFTEKIKDYVKKSKGIFIKIDPYLSYQQRDLEGNIVELRGYGYDENALAIGAPLQAASFENYGIAVMIEDDSIVRAQLNMFDRNISIVYLQ